MFFYVLCRILNNCWHIRIIDINLSQFAIENRDSLFRVFPRCYLTRSRNSLFRIFPRCYLTRSHDSPLRMTVVVSSNQPCTHCQIYAVVRFLCPTVKSVLISIVFFHNSYYRDSIQKSPIPLQAIVTAASVRELLTASKRHPWPATIYPFFNFL